MVVNAARTSAVNCCSDEHREVVESTRVSGCGRRGACHRRDPRSRALCKITGSTAINAA
jgi:hypothetical protein